MTADLRTVSRLVDPDRLATLLERLIAADSANPPGREASVASVLERHFARQGLRTDTREALPGRPNLTVSIGAGEPVLLLNAHTDTMPVGPGWTRPPLKASLENGLVFGRGACDAKGGLAAMAEAVIAVVASGVSLRGSVVLDAVADEEGGAGGTRAAIAAKLTGGIATDPVDACATSLYDLGAGTWSDEMVEAARARRGALPPILRPESIAGVLEREAATELGLRPGIPVIVGAVDDVEVLGNGLLANGARLEHLGTTGSILAVAGTALRDPVHALEQYPHTVLGMWLLGGSMTTAGAAIEWAAATLGYHSLSEATECLRLWPPSRGLPLFLPNLEGARSPRREPHARGAWLALGRETTRADLMLAAFEGVALGIHGILRRTDDLLQAAGPVVVSGGASADPRWLQVRADVYGVPLAVLATPEPTALGIFTLAAAALGVKSDPAAASRRVVRTERIVEPAPWPARRGRIEAADRIGAALGDAWPELAAASLDAAARGGDA